MIQSLTYDSVVAQRRRCSSIVQRREIRTLSNEERTKFINAVLRLHERESDNEPSINDRLTRIHLSVSREAHGRAHFLPWHRAFLREFEIALQRIDPSIAIPYWDWAHDSQAPHLSPIWRNDWFGGNGRRSDNCVVNGPFRNWRPLYPQPHCLRRNWDRGNSISPFHSPEAIEEIVQDPNKSFDEFRDELEAVPHGRVHTSIGGDMEGMSSPNDPLFLLHHAFVDKIWADWQETRSNRMGEYNGVNFDNSRAHLDDRLWPLNYRVRDVMNTRDLCYTYAPFNDNSRRSRARRHSLVERYDESSDVQVDIQNVNENTSNTIERLEQEVAATVNEAKTVVFAQNDIITPKWDCDTEIFALKHVKPVPDDWLKRQQHNITSARRTEAILFQAIEKANRKPDYISPAAPINHPDILSRIISDNNNLVATLADRRIEIDLQPVKNTTVAIQNILDCVFSELSKTKYQDK
jgi:hypothetical protein